jgi:ferrous iron transport protein A
MSEKNKNSYAGNERQVYGSNENSGSQPLSVVAGGTKIRVISLLGGRGFNARAIGMGISPGCTLTVLKQSRGKSGPILVGLGDHRLMVGHGMAEKIIVEPCG